jgi:hypothetical protein
MKGALTTAARSHGQMQTENPIKVSDLRDHGPMSGTQDLISWRPFTLRPLGCDFLRVSVTPW